MTTKTTTWSQWMTTVCGNAMMSGLDRVKAIVGSNSAKRSSDAGLGDESKPTTRSLISQFELYFISVQSILIWERPYVSAIVLIGFNCLYWLIMTWSRRFYSILLLVYGFIHTYKFWANYVWPEISVPISADLDTEGWTPVHPQILSAPEIHRYIDETLTMIKNIYAWFVELRKTQPGLFCTLVTFILTIAALVGHIVPGVVIVYVILMTLALGPGVALYVVPANWYKQVRSFFGGETSDQETDGKTSDINELQVLSVSKLAFDQYEEALGEKLLESNYDDESSMQLLSQSLISKTLDTELGLREVNNFSDGETSNQDRSSFSNGRRKSQDSDRSGGSSNGIHFVPTYFSQEANNGDDDDDEDYEIVSETEFQLEYDNNKDKKPLESHL